MTNEELSEYWKLRTHDCGALPISGVDVQYLKGCSIARPPCWTLRLIREATEQDLEENHILEEVGESIWTVTLEITHCPYCGMHLDHPDLSSFPDYGTNENEIDDEWDPFGSFTLFDQQDWSGVMR